MQRCKTLKKNFYPIINDVAIYSKDVNVFRDSNLDMCQSWNIDLVAVAAIQYPRLINNHLIDIDYKLTKNKIELIFLIAIANNHDSLVLSALGCGAFKNPPEDIVNIFNELLSKYKKFFKVITFAILPNNIMKERSKSYQRNPSQCNYEYFSKYVKN